MASWQFACREVEHSRQVRRRLGIVPLEATLDSINSKTLLSEVKYIL